MNLNWLIDGPNLAFVLPLVLALIYLGLYIASGITFGDPDVSADMDADADAHGGVDADTDAHVDAHAHVDTDANVDHDVAHPHGMIHEPGHHGAHGERPAGSATFNMLSWFGVGRVPISLWLSGAMLGWGAFGIAAASVTHERAFDVRTALLLSIAVALVGALATTRMLALIVTRVVPIHETYAKRRHGRLGSVGEAIFPIDAAFGMVGIRDERGEFFQVGCRAEAGVGTIAKGTRVKLVGYNRDTTLYHVVPVDAEVGV